MPWVESFEQEIKKHFDQEGIRFSDNSSAYDKLDFTIHDKTGRPIFHLEVKEKRQKYNMKHWFPLAPEPELFVLDDLTVRKCLAHAPESGVMIRDNIRKRYYFFPVIDLALMPRVRVNRPINRNQPDLKGKWLIDLRNGKKSLSLDRAVFNIRFYLRDLDTHLFKTLECYGDYVGENIEEGGVIRKPEHWDEDVKSTR